MMLTSIAQAESPRHDGIALTPVYAHQKVKNIYTWTASCLDTHVHDAWDTTGGLNHREGGYGIQRAVVQACVVGHFGSRTTQPESCKDFRNPPTHT